MKFEIKILLVFGAAISLIIYFGPGNISYAEAKLRSINDTATLSASELQKLTGIKTQFTNVAIARCMESSASKSENLSVVMELGGDGSVVRTWRLGDSRFIVCIQKSLTDNFVFRSGRQKLIIEYFFAPD